MMAFRQRWREYGLWTASFVVVLAVHVAAGAAALMTRMDDDLMANLPVITIDLAPIAAAPELVPTDLAIGPQQVETPPEAEPPPPPDTVSIEPPKPVEKPPEKKKTARLTTAPTPAKKHAPVAIAPAPGAGMRDSDALPNWKSQLVAMLERNKRYPSDARGDQGVAQLAFSVDRSGGIHHPRIVRSSGSSALDNETLALARRASPLPPPPTEVRGGLIAIVVPIRYHVR